MPDTWESATFGNLTRDGTGDFDSDGYTDLEEFLNLVDGSVINIPQITRTDNNPTSIVQGGTYIPPTGTWTDVEDGSGVATVSGDTVDVNTVGTYNVTLSHTDTDGNTGSLTIPYIITSGVINVTDVDVSPKTETVTIGQSTVISVTITPNNATNQNGVWSSSNNSVATIDQSGRVTGLSEGNTTIAFTSSDGDFTDTSVITVISQSQNTGGISKKQKIKLINN